MILFEIVDFKPQPREEFQATAEVQDLYALKYNKGPGDHDGRKRLRAQKELMYVYYYVDYRSQFSQYPERMRSQKALEAAGLPDDHPMSVELISVIGAYGVHITKGNRNLRLLEASRKAVDKLENFFSNVKVEIDEADGLDVQEKKTTIAGKVMDNLGKVQKITHDLEKLEERIRKEQSTGTRIQGDAEPGRLA